MDTTEEPGESLRARISARLGQLTRAERRVAEYLRNNSQDVVFATAEQIGAASQTSDATVVRTAKSLGYSGLIELKYSLGHEVLNAGKAVSRMHTRIEQTSGDTETLLAQVFTEAVERLTETWRGLPGADFERAVELLGDARTVAAIGIGPSEFVAGYLALRLTRLGRAAWASGATGWRLADDLLRLGEGDVVVLYAPSRLTKDIGVLLAHAREVAAKTILVTDSLGGVLGERVDLVLPSVYSPSGFSGEGLSAQILTDALLVAVASADLPRVGAAADRLAGLRSALTSSAGADYVRRKDRGTAQSTTDP